MQVTFTQRMHGMPTYLEKINTLTSIGDVAKADQRRIVRKPMAIAGYTTAAPISPTLRVTYNYFSLHIKLSRN